jgi:hypothetical protein
VAIGLSKSTLETQIASALNSGLSPKEVHGAVAKAIAEAVAGAIDRNNREIERKLTGP